MRLRGNINLEQSSEVLSWLLICGKDIFQRTKKGEKLKVKGEMVDSSDLELGSEVLSWLLNKAVFFFQRTKTNKPNKKKVFKWQ